MCCRIRSATAVMAERIHSICSASLRVRRSWDRAHRAPNQAPANATTRWPMSCSIKLSAFATHQLPRRRRETGTRILGELCQKLSRFPRTVASATDSEEGLLREGG